MTARTRLDQALVDRGFAVSRARARDAILRGCVRVGGETATKPARPVSKDDSIHVDDPTGGFVSRAALKLLAALGEFGVDPNGRTVLDIGASTGGFTQVCLQRGAARVIAIDVGHGQMEPSLAADDRVFLLEGLNARDLTSEHLGKLSPDLIVCDTSFISLMLVLPPALALAAPGATGLFLVKPQFEVGRDGIGKGGIVKPAIDTEAVARSIADWLSTQQGWAAAGLMPSPLPGGDGNREWLLHGHKHP